MLLLVLLLLLSVAIAARDLLIPTAPFLASAPLRTMAFEDRVLARLAGFEDEVYVQLHKRGVQE